MIQAEKEDRLSGPLLFSGPAATGKKQAARWLARRDRCQSTGQQPCDSCPSCRQAIAQQHPDIVEVRPELGERIGIDLIRDTLQPLRVKAWSGHTRWLLILDAERLTEQAGNVLLKFLEELPSRCRVILTSSQPDALLDTVRSRVTEYRWHFASTADMRRLSKDPQITQRAAGRPGWAESLSPEFRQSEEQRLLSVVQQQSLVTTGPRERQTDRVAIDQQLQTEEIIIRELLLAQVGAEQRMLWPSHRIATKKCAEVIGGVQLLDLAQRFLDRYELSPNIQPRLLYEDLHLV